MNTAGVWVESNPRTPLCSWQCGTCKSFIHSIGGNGTVHWLRWINANIYDTFATIVMNENANFQENPTSTLFLAAWLIFRTCCISKWVLVINSVTWPHNDNGSFIHWGARKTYLDTAQMLSKCASLSLSLLWIFNVIFWYSIIYENVAFLCATRHS